QMPWGTFPPFGGIHGNGILLEQKNFRKTPLDPPAAQKHPPFRAGVFFFFSNQKDIPITIII
ncbi:hypothetical protein, partial [Paenibacillus sp. GbtcB18]|uniref:hypothetical protein n=1 Tax=Paenibacillus sp. GbtcB18 TaxID=2824763 RepID=UPI001C2FD680